MLERNSESLLNLYCQEVARYRMLSNEEECAVIERMRQGDMQARKVLIESYLRLVVSMANNPKFRHQAEVLDLIQEGNIGLIKAADCFDAGMGYSFAGFATECIKNRMLLFVKNQPEELLVLDSKVFEDDEDFHVFLYPKIKQNYRILSKIIFLGNKNTLRYKNIYKSMITYISFSLAFEKS